MRRSWVYTENEPCFQIPSKSAAHLRPAPVATAMEKKTPDNALGQIFLEQESRRPGEKRVDFPVVSASHRCLTSSLQPRTSWISSRINHAGASQWAANRGAASTGLRSTPAHAARLRPRWRNGKDIHFARQPAVQPLSCRLVAGRSQSEADAAQSRPNEEFCRRFLFLKYYK